MIYIDQIYIIFALIIAILIGCIIGFISGRVYSKHREPVTLRAKTARIKELERYEQGYYDRGTMIKTAKIALDSVPIEDVD